MLVLLTSAFLVMVFRTNPQVGLAIGLGGVVGTIVVMGFVANRYLNRSIAGDPKETDEPENR